MIFFHKIAKTKATRQGDIVRNTRQSIDEKQRDLL